MAKVPGQSVHGGMAVTLAGDGSPARGDAVAIASGQVTQAFDDGTTVNPAVGVMSDTNDPAADNDAGDNVSVELAGVVIANVASGITAGEQLGASGTNNGELAAGSDDIFALSDEGGTYQGASLDAGYAAVHLG